VDPGPPLRDIGCFTAVAQRLSFSRAAAGLGMSQPAVSQAVARLERALGLRLFERTSREVQLSDAGKVLLPLAEALLDQVAAFSAEAARLAVPSGPAIRLAYCPLVGGLAARVARRLARRSPGIEVELRVAGWSAATAELAQGTAPAALMSTPFPAGLASTARFRLPISHLAVPAGGPLAGATRLRLGQLARHDVLLPRLRPAGSVWARLAALLPEATTTTRSRATADDLDDLTAALDLVAAGQGLLPVPRLLAQTVLRPDIRFLPLDTGGLAMTYGLVWSPDRATAEVMALVQAVQQILRSPVQTGLR
jgi:DNA-binding transcriptional LysR family regulator